MMPDPMERSALLSPCGTYRYRLGRKWGPGPICTFLMLNPSTADADIDDRTIGRCVSFAEREGCDAIHVVNLFALRATDPKALAAATDPVGPTNDAEIRDAVRVARRHGWPVIAAWGAHAFARSRAEEVLDMVSAILGDGGSRLRCLGTTQAGHPRHPLYVKGDTPLIDFPARSARPSAKNKDHSRAA